MKRRSVVIISCLLVLAMCISLLSACIKIDDDTVGFEFEKFVRNHRYIESATDTHTVPNKIAAWDEKGNNAEIYVKWNLGGTDAAFLDLVDGDEGTTVVIPAERPVSLSYTLTATFTNSKGKAYVSSDRQEYSHVFNCTAPVSTGTGTGGGTGGGDSAATPAATLSLIGTGTRDSYSADQLVHKGDGITYTNDKSNSATVCFNNSKEDWATRVYKGATVTVEYTSDMTAIVFTMDDAVYNSKQYMDGFDGMSVAGATITRDNDIVTVVLSTPAKSFQSAELSSQCRIESVEVYTNGVPETGNTGGSGGTGDDTGTGDSNTSQAGTFEFSFETNFSTYASSWTNQYSSQTVSASALGVSNASVSFVFSNVSKQTNTISNLPVMASKAGAEQYVTATATDKAITSVTFNLTEWVPQGNGAAKTFTTLTIQYSINGSDWVDTNVGLVNGTASQASDYPTLTCSNLPSGVIAVRLVIVGNPSASGNQQVGISSCSLVLA